MIERVVELPVSTGELWETLTDPAQIGTWFGADVAWELEPGGTVFVQDDDGDERAGRIEEIDAPRRLRFSWWPVGDPTDASEVTYTVEPTDEGSLLTITERRNVLLQGSAQSRLDRRSTASTHVAAGTVRSDSWNATVRNDSSDVWSVWDERIATMYGRVACSAIWC